MPKKVPAPDWKNVFKKEPRRIGELMDQPEAFTLIQKANAEYLHWDKFRRQPMPAGASPELLWTLVKMTRAARWDDLPLTDASGIPMSISSAKEHLQSLSYIDRYASGSIVSLSGMPNESQKGKLVINGLMEEAISSSQIEGANTTRKAAKLMIETGSQPKNKSERMIFNNYRAMTQIESWGNRKLDDSFLLELHEVLSEETLDSSSDEGRFRRDDDDIVVSDRLTGETVHTPPTEKEARRQLDQLYAFANAKDEDGPYIHPFVKASILHFSIGYIHPFVDGNGRMARAIFYWYLIKKNYWMFKFLPISLQIKKKEWRPAYDRAFQQVETDPLDVTYFLNYKLKLACNAIRDFITYLERKQREANTLKQRLLASDEINSRQLDLISFMQGDPAIEIDLSFYKNRNDVVYETARRDLMALVDKRILSMHKNGRKFVYVRGENFPSE